MKNKILLLCTLTLCSALFSTVYSAFGAGGDLLWEKTEQLVVGEEAKAASIITVYDRALSLAPASPPAGRRGGFVRIRSPEPSPGNISWKREKL